jgi:hypothetical protein
MNIGNMHVLSKNNEFDTISENLRNRAKQDGRLLNAFGKTTMDLEMGQQKSDIHLEPELLENSSIHGGEFSVSSTKRVYISKHNVIG